MPAHGKSFKNGHIKRRNLKKLDSPPDKKLLRLELREYYHHRDELSQVDGVPLYKGRVIVPVALCAVVLETVHSALQGVTGRTLRAQGSVWWPDQGTQGQVQELYRACSIPTQCSSHAATTTRLSFPVYRL